MALVGIDLGTTNSLISVFTDDGPQLIENALGEVLTPSAVGISDKGEIIIGAAAKNRLVSRVVTNSTMQKGQKGVNIEVYQGESPMVANNVKLGSFYVAVPHNTAGYEAFDIRFTYDVSGILEVIVTTVTDNKSKTLVIEGNPGSIPKDEIAKRFKELEKLKVHPRDAAENTALISRFERAYENSLGDLRQHIGHNLENSWA